MWESDPGGFFLVRGYGEGKRGDMCVVVILVCLMYWIVSCGIGISFSLFMFDLRVVEIPGISDRLILL